MSHTQLLYRLQVLDSKIDQAQRELTEVRANLGESEPLKQAKQQVASAEQESRRGQTTLKDLELEVKGLADKISTQEKLLYSGRAVSAKEAANLQDEIASLKKWHSTREELLLETMVEAEEKENYLDQTQQALSQMEAIWRADQGDLIDKQANLEAAITTLQAQRPSISDSIEATLLATYDALRPKKAGVAVAGVKSNMCQSCGIMVSNSKVQRARSGTELIYCGTCGRILHIL